MNRRSLLPILGMPFILSLARRAAAQPDWPTRPVRLVIPFPPGGSNDAIGRPLANELSRALGQPVVVDNKGGAGSTIGTAEVVRSPADGYTLMSTSSTFATSAAVQATPYDAAKDLAMIALIATAPLVILSSPGFPPNTMAEAIAYIRANPGKVDYGSAGIGSIGHMGGALFAQKAGLDMQHVPYRGTGPVMNDLLTDTIQLTFTTATATAGLISSGKVKVLGWTSEERPANGPAAPTPRESGLPDYEAGIWWGVIGRRDLPEQVRTRVNAAVNAALGGGPLATGLANEGARPRPSSLEEADRFLQADLRRWRDLAATAGIRVE
jgi:tripartite-type tricarboxylate transporter receptor subunit TctC